MRGGLSEVAEVTSCLQSQPRIKPVRGMRYVSAQNAKEGVCTCNSVVLSDVCNTAIKCSLKV